MGFFSPRDKFQHVNLTEVHVNDKSNSDQSESTLYLRTIDAVKS
jgi:hypothetical protein